MTPSTRTVQQVSPAPLSGLRVAVTGGTSGLGLALVETAIARGARVAFVARTRDRVDQVTRTLRGARGVVGDVSRQDDIYPIALQLAAALGGLDVLVNNASSLGPVPLAPLADTACEDLEAALATNLLGPFRLTKAVLGSLTASARDGRGGLVVNISSDAAVTPYRGVGCLWCEQGGTPPPHPHLERGGRRAGCADGVLRSWRHGHAAPRRGTAGRRSLAAEAAGRVRARAVRSDRDAVGPAPTGRGCHGGAAVIAASRPVQRPADARVLWVDADGRLWPGWRRDWVDGLRRGDVVVANDAATIPASLRGTHLRSGRPIEVRLAGRDSLLPAAIDRVSAIVFGEGDHRTPTERRAVPPRLVPGDRLLLGPLTAQVSGILDHPRFVSLTLDGPVPSIWEAIARHGRPVQYAHVPDPLAIWDTWTALAAQPVAFEPPSAGFALSWAVVRALSARGIRFATVTHAAGLSSTGDPRLDARLPLDEPYDVPRATARLVNRARAHGRRIIAVGTSVVRALEHAARATGHVRAGHGLATGRLGPGSRLRIVDALLSGTHEPGTSHYQLLRAFVTDTTLTRMDAELASGGYRTHEFGDSIFIERDRGLGHTAGRTLNPEPEP